MITSKMHIVRWRCVRVRGTNQEFGRLYRWRIGIEAIWLGAGISRVAPARRLDFTDHLLPRP